MKMKVETVRCFSGSYQFKKQTNKRIVLLICEEMLVILSYAMAMLFGDVDLMMVMIDNGILFVTFHNLVS